MMNLSKSIKVITIAASLVLTGTIATNIYSREKDFGPWKQVLQTKNDMGQGALATLAGFIDKSNGVTVGRAGAVYYTKNAGKKWLMGNNNSYCRFGMYFLDKNIGWHCGNMGNVGITKDGGKNWKPETNYGDSEPDQCRFLSFTDVKTGWIAAPTKLAVTTNGCKTWKEIKVPKDKKDIVAISLRTSKEGYLLKQDGSFYITKDSGKTWDKKSLGFSKSEGIEPAMCPTAVVKFFDENKGIVIFDGKDKKVWTYKTTDGGNTWEKLVNKDMKRGYLFLNSTGKLLTVTSIKGKDTLEYDPYAQKTIDVFEAK